MKNCPYCGNWLDDTAGFCAKCGSAQPTYVQQPQQNYTYTQQTYAQQPQQNYGYAQQQTYAQQPMYQPAPMYQRPVGMLKTNRGLLKLILLSMITFGIYGLVVMSGISSDINTIASRYDGRKTMHFCLLFFIVGPITFGIADIVWSHNISNRIGNELKRRFVPYSFGASDFWLWGILGSLIVIGPLVYTHKLLKAMNLLCQNYNIYG